MNKKQAINIEYFTKQEIPVDELNKFDIHIPSYYREHYRGVVYIMEDEIHVQDIYLDDLERESGKDYFFVFRKDVYIENALIQQDSDSGPVTTFQGNVTARNIWLGGGDTTFNKDVIVAQTLIGIYNHGTAIVRGAVEAEVIISDDLAMNIKNIKKGYTYGLREREHSGKDLFQSKYYDKGEENLNQNKILKAIITGNSIINTQSIQSPLDKRFAKMQNSKEKKLDLSYMDLREIPKEVWSLADITSLDISGNYLTDIPIEIINLKCLKKINIENCEFSVFPSVLFQLTGLEEIAAGQNQLSDLPDNILALQSLKKLTLNQDHFEAIPKALYCLPQLLELDFSDQESGCKLLINETFPKLKKLNLQGNSQPEISTVQPKLVELNISNCRLNVFPEVISEMNNLSVLYMKRNFYPTLPLEIKKLTNLKEFAFDLFSLDIQGVKILNELPKLKTIRVNNNDRPASEIEELLSISNWTKLYTDDYIEDMFVCKKILERSNLEVLEIEEERQSLKELREQLGISM